MNEFLFMPVAYARVDGATGNALSARGCVTGRTNPGLYTIFLDNIIQDANSMIAVITAEGPAFPSFTHTSLAIKTIQFFPHDAFPPIDVTFSIVIYQVTGGTAR